MKRVIGLLLALVLAVSCLSTGAYAAYVQQAPVAEAAAVPAAAPAGVRHDRLPDHMVVGYWHNFCNGSSNIKLRDVPSYYDLVCIAFTENTSVGGRGTFAVDPDLAVALGGYTKEEMIQDIKLLQARGQHVIISVGGALGRISIKDDTEAQNFADSMTQIIREYGLEGIDIDLEGGSVSATQYIASSLRTMHNTFGEDFIITMAPETLYIENEERPYAQLLMEVKDILTVVFPQFYNTGCMEGFDGKMVNPRTADMMTSMSTTLIERFGLRDDQIAFGVPNNTKSSGSGFYTYAETKKAVEAFMNGTKANRFTAPHAYPGFRGMMAWSVNWDNTANYSWAKSMSALMDEVSGLAPQSAPTAVPNVKIEAGEERVKLSWDRIPGAESYEIYDCTSGQKLIMNTSCDFYVVPNLTNGQNYKFCVKASNAAGTGAASAVVSATPKDLPNVFPFYEEWKATKEYKAGGTRVNYKGMVYENKYYASGSSPDTNDAWKLIGPYQYCGDGFGNGGSSQPVPEPETVVPTGITMNPKKLDLVQGEVASLSAAIAPADATDKSLTWASSNPAVAVVANGKVTAVAAGTAQITAKTCNGLTAACVVTVEKKTVEVDSVKLNPAKLTLEIGEQAAVKAAVTPANAENKTLTWTSSNPAVAQVDNGRITAVGVGTARITAASANGKSAQCVVTVKAPATEPTAPETTVPETTVPETTVPATTVPETTVPETTVPETTVPETTQATDPTEPVEAPQWTIYTAYAKGDLVTFGDQVYECRIGHTSLEGWEPVSVPALWSVYSGEVPEPTVPETTDPEPTEPDPTEPGDTWQAGKVYNGGETVVYNGQKYTAKWWTLGERPDPANRWGVWKLVK